MTEAQLHYATPDYVVLAPGDHVRCAVSGRVIPLEALLYWSVELQEPYASAELMMRRRLETDGEAA